MLTKGLWEPAFPELVGEVPRQAICRHDEAAEHLEFDHSAFGCHESFCLEDQKECQRRGLDLIGRNLGLTVVLGSGLIVHDPDQLVVEQVVMAERQKHLVICRTQLDR